MNKIAVIFIYLAASTLGFAGTTTYKELVDKIEHGIRVASTGNSADGFGEISAEGRKQKSPQERATDMENLRTVYAKLQQLGATRQIDRVSLVFLGDVYFRVRFVERKEKGAILWTFIGEKWKDEWFLSDMRFSGNSALLVLMQELDAADCSKEGPKEP